ncbi:MULTISPECIES: Ycf34 family protein [unclassified Synechococcus]|jgi:hypothetical protein|uniref:Ycf34 family protein n=1 Tax=unclassified Synechococcus TaxID=2626047 RepID=UPI0020CD8C23|nr:MULTISPECIES: Ycf34 family protein [unclassified Synechococcus]MCP9940484.1 Ycf34 family protein [Synechococcus sp. Cruz CV12-2-Slac-r]MDA0290919.1 Ycf34 family protein [Cyanobacteriota bacterium]MDA1169989.1 Ycf34 family protein [Cyanobacteriota bacterium]
MCICVACSWQPSCTAYHRVETEHGVPHLNQNPDFTPENPQIHLSVQAVQNSWGVEWDVRSCDSFRPGRVS